MSTPQKCLLGDTHSQYGPLHCARLCQQWTKPVSECYCPWAGNQLNQFGNEVSCINCPLNFCVTKLCLKMTEGQWKAWFLMEVPAAPFHPQQKVCHLTQTFSDRNAQ